RTSDAIGDRERRIRTEYELRDPHTRLGRKTTCDGLAQSLFQCVALILTVRADHDLRERRIGQFRSHRQEKAWCTLPDVRGDDPDFLLFRQPCLHLLSSGAGL